MKKNPIRAAMPQPERWDYRDSLHQAKTRGINNKHEYPRRFLLWTECIPSQSRSFQHALFKLSVAPKSENVMIAPAQFQ